MDRKFPYINVGAIRIGPPKGVSRLEPETLAYSHRVKDGNGVVTDLAFTNQLISFCKSRNIYQNLRTMVGRPFGMHLRDGQFVTKLFDASSFQTDFARDSEINQPVVTPIAIRFPDAGQRSLLYQDVDNKLALRNRTLTFFINGNFGGPDSARETIYMSTMSANLTNPATGGGFELQKNESGNADMFRALTRQTGVNTGHSPNLGSPSFANKNSAKTFCVKLYSHPTTADVTKADFYIDGVYTAGVNGPATGTFNDSGNNIFIGRGGSNQQVNGSLRTLVCIEGDLTQQTIMDFAQLFETYYSPYNIVARLYGKAFADELDADSLAYIVETLNAGGGF